MFYTLIQDNRFPKGFYSEEIHGKFKIEDKKNKEEIPKELYEVDLENYRYFKKEEIVKKQKEVTETIKIGESDEEIETKTITKLVDDGEELKVTYYRIPLIPNPNCKIPTNAIPIPENIKNEIVTKKARYKYENGNWVKVETTEKEIVEKRKTKLQKKVKRLSKEKLQKVKNYLAGREITKEDEDRYKFKYELALNNKDDLLKGEAEKRSISVEEFKKLVINKHQEWLDTIYYFSQKIEEFRLVISEQIEKATTLKEIDLIDYKINVLATLNEKISDEEFNKLLNLTEINKEIDSEVSNVFNKESLSNSEGIFTKVFNKLFG